jgi:hypothetical protein
MSVALWLGALGLALSAGAVAALRRKRTRPRLAALGLGVGLLLPGLLGLTLQQSLVGYIPLHREQQVATIAFTREGPNLWLASLQLPDGTVRPLQLHGDEWQIDARILTWKGWADWLGMRPLYRFERLSGRYTDVDDERRQPRSVHALCERGDGWWQDWMRNGTRIPGADAYYGTAAYLPMADGAGYRISVSPSGLVVRPDNPAANQAVDAWPAPSR